MQWAHSGLVLIGSSRSRLHIGGHVNGRSLGWRRRRRRRRRRRGWRANAKAQEACEGRHRPFVRLARVVWVKPLARLRTRRSARVISCPHVSACASGCIARLSLAPLPSFLPCFIRFSLSVKEKERKKERSLLTDCLALCALVVLPFFPTVFACPRFCVRSSPFPICCTVFRGFWPPLMFPFRSSSISIAKAVSHPNSNHPTTLPLDGG